MAVLFARCNVASVVSLGLVLVTMLTMLTVVRGEGVSVCSKDVNGNPMGGDEYMCVDWSVGSGTMKDAQGKHYANTQEDVIFGIGSYGGINDNMGKCYQFNIGTSNTPIIGQVTNFGKNIGPAQFDMQMGAGGFGVWNACADATYHATNEKNPCSSATEAILAQPGLFPGGQSGWGTPCGGQTTIGGCTSLPDKPTQLKVLPNNEPTLVQLCQEAFSWNVRDSNSVSVGIVSGQRIACPSALVDVTTLKRTDDSNFATETMSAGVLTSTMDCCAPAGAYTSNNPKVGTISGFQRIIPCEGDGYTRSLL